MLINIVKWYNLSIQIIGNQYLIERKLTVQDLMKFVCHERTSFHIFHAKNNDFMD